SLQEETPIARRRYRAFQEFSQSEGPEGVFLRPFPERLFGLSFGDEARLRQHIVSGGEQGGEGVAPAAQFLVGRAGGKNTGVGEGVEDDLPDGRGGEAVGGGELLAE